MRRFRSKLKFQLTWMRGWLRRCCLRRRRVSTQVQQHPSPADVQMSMAEIQKKFIDGGYSSAEVFSGDESGMLFGVYLAHLSSLSMSRMMLIEQLRWRRTTSTLYFVLVWCCRWTYGTFVQYCQMRFQQPFNHSGTRIIIQNFERHSSTSSLGWTVNFWELAIIMPAKNHGPLQLTECKPWYLIVKLSYKLSHLIRRPALAVCFKLP